MHVAVTTSTLEGRPGGRLIFTSVHDAADVRPLGRRGPAPFASFAGAAADYFAGCPFELAPRVRLRCCTAATTSSGCRLIVTLGIHCRNYTRTAVHNIF